MKACLVTLQKQAFLIMTKNRCHDCQELILGVLGKSNIFVCLCVGYVLENLLFVFYRADSTPPSLLLSEPNTSCGSLRRLSSLVDTQPVGATTGPSADLCRLDEVKYLQVCFQKNFLAGNWFSKTPLLYYFFCLCRLSIML